MAIVKSSKNIKRRVLWIKLQTRKLSHSWLSHQYGMGDVYYLHNVKYNNKIGLLNHNRKKKSKFLVNKVYSWKLLRLRHNNLKSAVLSIPFLLK